MKILKLKLPTPVVEKQRALPNLCPLALNLQNSTLPRLPNKNREIPSLQKWMPRKRSWMDLESTGTAQRLCFWTKVSIPSNLCSTLFISNLHQISTQAGCLRLHLTTLRDNQSQKVWPNGPPALVCRKLSTQIAFQRLKEQVASKLIHFIDINTFFNLSFRLVNWS